MAKYGHLADQSGLQFIPVVFSHTGQIHAAFKDLRREQIRQKIVAFEGQAKPSKINPVLKWWSKYISMFIAKTASRNVVYKATKLAESIFERQSEMLISEEDLAARSSVSYEEDLEDLGCNADLYIFNDETVEDYRNTDISTQESTDLFSEMHTGDAVSFALHGTGPISVA